VDIDDAIIYRPADMVGDVVPRGVAIVVNPISDATREGVGVSFESDLCIGGVVGLAIIRGRDIHVPFPGTFKSVGDLSVFAGRERDGCCGNDSHHEGVVKILLHNRYVLNV
jgi:hypothetical protein